MRRGEAVALVLLLFAPGCETAPTSAAGAGNESGASAQTSIAIHASPSYDQGPEPPRPANSAETAIVAPLTAGSELAGFQVKAVQTSDGRALDVVCQKGAARIVLTVALYGQGGPSPPASTDRYAVFYSLRGAEPEDGERLAKALASVLEANKNVPPPPGLGPFVPRPLSL